MIKLENVVLASPEQMEFIIEGMRNPMNSWEKSDSFECTVGECDICGDEIEYSSLPFSKDKIYKIKCYDSEGDRKKKFDCSYVCSRCMYNLALKIKEEKNGGKRSDY